MNSMILTKLVVVVLLFSFSIGSFSPGAQAQDMTQEQRAGFLIALDGIVVQLQKIQELLNLLFADEGEEKSGTTVQSIAVVVDHLEDSATAKISYSAGKKTSITIKSEQKTQIIRTLASKLNLKTSEVESIISFTFLNADAPTKLLVTIKSSRNISLKLTLADDSVINDVVPVSTFDGLINSMFFGSTDLYNSVFDSYVTEIKRGHKPTDVISLIAESAGLSYGEVFNIIDFEVSANYNR